MEEREVVVPKPPTTAPLLVHFGLRPNDKGEPSNEERRKPSVKRVVKKCQSEMLTQQI